jgi:hypothetical protein
MADADSEKSSADRWRYGIIAVVVGVFAILGAFALALTQFKTSTDIAAVLGVVITPIATIVAAYFGVQAGSAGKEKAEENVLKNVAAGASLAAANGSDQVDQAVRSFR